MDEVLNEMYRKEETETRPAEEAPAWERFSAEAAPGPKLMEEAAQEAAPEPKLTSGEAASELKLMPEATQEAAPESVPETARPRYQLLSGSALKMIALITMIIDHIGAAILEMGVIEGYNTGVLNISYETALYWWNVDSVLRAIGRISFPIYCFLITEGFVHTRNPGKYALRLGMFALLSEIPFDLAFFHSWCDPAHQNVFFTLLLGLLAIMAIDYYEKRMSSRWVGLTAAFCFVMLGDVLHTDYGAFGVFFIVVLYAFRNCGWIRTLIGCLLVAWETTAPLAFVPIQMYNGERGRLRLKYFFYAIYPVHLLILYGICMALWR